MVLSKWARLLSKSQFTIEQNKHGEVEFRISQIIGDTRWASRYILSARFASDEIAFSMALDRFLESFEQTVFHAQAEL